MKKYRFISLLLVMILIFRYEFQIDSGVSKIDFLKISTSGGCLKKVEDLKSVDVVKSEGEFLPIKFDCDEWSEMSYSEQLESCMLEDDYIKSLSTNELLNVALEYPFKLDFMLYDDWEKGIDHLRKTSNIVDELLSRPDVASLLVGEYVEMCKKNNLQTTDVDYDMLNVDSGLDREVFIVSMIVHGDVSQNLSKEEYEVLGSEITMQINNSQVGEDLGAVGLFLNDEDFVERLDTEASDSLMGTEGFVNSGNIFCNGKNNVYYYAGKYFKYQYYAECYKYYSNDISDSIKKMYREEMSKAHPSWVYIAEATGKYNCHSYCWIRKNKDNIYWLGSAEPYAASTIYFKNCGTNVKISQPNSYVILNDMSGPTHSVRTMDTAAGMSQGYDMKVWLQSCMCDSKLGTGGVYRAPLYDIYMLYDAVSYRVFTEK